MNKTKRVAWRKHRIKAKKYEEKRKAQKASGAIATPTARRLSPRFPFLDER